MESESLKDRGEIIRYLDQTILFCFCVLVIFLPIAHTETVRAFSLGIPAGLWIIKMIVSRRFLFSRTPLDLPILLFTLIAGLSVITASDWGYSLNEFIGEWIIGVFLFYLIVNNVHSGQMKYIIGALLVGNIVMIGYGSYDFFRNGGNFLTYETRAYSLHSGVGTFSTYLVTLIPYVLIAIFFARKAASRVVIFLLFALNIFALLLTYSRGSWIAVGGLFILTGWIFFPRRMRILLMALLLPGIFSLIYLGIPSYYYGKFTAFGKTGAYPDSYHGRWILAKYSLEKIGENPFRMIGYGRRSFIKEHKEFYKKYEGLKMSHAHNTFLNIAMDTGLQGLVIFIFLLYKILKHCYDSAQKKTVLERFFHLSTFLMVITFFIRNLSDDFFVDDSALLLWFLVGTSVALKRGGNVWEGDRAAVRDRQETLERFKA